MNVAIFVLMTLVAAAAVALVIFLGGLVLVPARTALRLGDSAMIGGAIGFAGTALGMMPFHLSSTVGSEAWNSRDLKSRPH